MVDQYAVIGNPIAHSKSPFIHAEFAKQTNQDMEYKAILVEENEFEKKVFELQQQGVKGLNITLPFKQKAFAIAHRVLPEAKRTDVVNTLKFEVNGEIVGDNTDGVGLLQDLKKNLSFEIRGKKILILGAGGAVQGILPSLLQEQPEMIVLANRTLAKAEILRKKYASDKNFSVTSYEDLPHFAFDLIVNGTSASLQNVQLPLFSELLHSSTLCYDMMYSAKLTPFLTWCKNEAGAVNLADGIGMLVEQAAHSFKLWRGIMPDTVPVLAKLRELLKDGNNHDEPKRQFSAKL